MRSIVRARALLPCLLAALAVSAGSLLTACGDDAALAGGDGEGDLGGDASGAGGGWGASDGAVGPGASGTTGTGAGEAPPQTPAPGDDEEEPPPACDALDETKPLVLYLSADDSNSLASPAEAREAIRAGISPASVRTYEFLNYYDVAFPAPAYPDLALFADAAPADDTGSFDLMLAVRAHDAPETRRPMTMTFVVDTSGSMEGAPIARARATVRAIAGELQAGDIVNVLTWNTDNLVALEGHAVTGPDDATLLSVASSLGASGGTDLDGGLRAGYELATEHWGDDRLNRVVLISDGGANVGETSAEVIGVASDDADHEGIYLVGVGVGPIEWYSDALMDVVTDMGRGAYVYLDSEDEAEVMFGDRFDETMEIAARDVRVEVTLPWYFQMQRFYGEEYSEDPEEVDPQHLAPGDATVILQTIRACDAEIVDPADPVRLRATWQTPLARQSREAVIEATVGELLAQDHGRLDEARAIVGYAEALKTGDRADLTSALQAVRALPGAAQPSFAEIAGLLESHPAM
jgi:Ca-activated chloride channel family protein